MKNNSILFFSSHSKIFYSIGGKLFLAIFILVICYFLVKLIKGLIFKAYNKFGKIDETLTPVLNTISALTIYLVGIVIILDIFGVNTSSLITLLGAAGLTIGLALKDTLGNIAAGLVLLALRPFKVGDFIEFGSISGEVKKVGLFVTILETPECLFISAPNGSLWGVPIKNYTRNGRRRLDMIVGISYSDSIDVGFRVLQSIIESEKRFLSEPGPQVMVHSMADSSVNLQLRGWLSTDDYWDVYWQLNKTIKEKIQESGLTIPFPQRDVNICGHGRSSVI